MRVSSVAEFKGNGRVHNDLPTEGTYIRQVYDLFKENAGYPIQFDEMDRPSYTRFGAILIQLRDFYGCDIRRAGKWGERTYCLVGEWIGEHYTDYVADRFKDKQ